MTLLLPALLALPLAHPAAEDLPLADWMEELEQARTLTLELALTSSEGSEARVRFAYEAPDRCALWTDVEGEPTLRVWLEDGVATWHSRTPEGEWTTGGFDWAELSGGSGSWLGRLRERFPGDEAAVEHGAGPTLDLWPDLEGDRIELTLAHADSARSLFTWLTRLEGAALEGEREGEDWSCVVEGGGRFLLEPRLGVPRAVWMGADEDARQALRLVALEIDGEAAEELLAVPRAPEGAEDRSEQLAAAFAENAWRSARAAGYAWFEARVAEGLDLEEVAEEVHEVFAELHEAWSGAGLRQRREGELARLDEWLDRLGEWYDANREAEGASAKLVEVLVQGRDGVELRLGQVARQYAVRLEVPTGEGVDEAVLEDVLEHEQRAVADWIEAELSVPVRAHLGERLAGFEVELPE
jgi:hypothetical protein